MLIVIWIISHCNQFCCLLKSLEKVSIGQILQVADSCFGWNSEMLSYFFTGTVQVSLQCYGLLHFNIGFLRKLQETVKLQSHNITFCTIIFISSVNTFPVHSILLLFHDCLDCLIIPCICAISCTYIPENSHMYVIQTYSLCSPINSWMQFYSLHFVKLLYLPCMSSNTTEVIATLSLKMIKYFEFSTGEDFKVVYLSTKRPIEIVHYICKLHYSSLVWPRINH